KTLAAMEHGRIPPTPGSRPLNDALEHSAFIVPESARDWPAENDQRTAAVSSFGFGGNNAHLILTQNPLPARRRQHAPPPRAPLAIVGLGLRTHLDQDVASFAARQFGD